MRPEGPQPRCGPLFLPSRAEPSRAGAGAAPCLCRRRRGKRRRTATRTCAARTCAFRSACARKRRRQTGLKGGNLLRVGFSPHARGSVGRRGFSLLLAGCGFQSACAGKGRQTWGAAGRGLLWFQSACAGKGRQTSNVGRIGSPFGFSPHARGSVGRLAEALMADGRPAKAFQSACAGKRRQTFTFVLAMGGTVSVRMRGEASADSIPTPMASLKGFSPHARGSVGRLPPGTPVTRP